MTKMIEVDSDTCYGCGEEAGVEWGDISVCKQCLFELLGIALGTYSEEETPQEEKTPE